MQRKFSGQNLMEVCILIALVGIVSIFVFMMLGGNVNTMFATSEVKVKEFNPFGNNYDKETGARIFAAGELGGSSSNPKSQCSGLACAIDYGDFVLNGVPENFGDFVETSGTAGGTTELANMMEEIADQLKENGDIDGYNEYHYCPVKLKS